jgi:hypothetical protein
MAPTMPDTLARAVVVSVAGTPVVAEAAVAAAVGVTTITATLVDHLTEMAIVTGSRTRITTVTSLRYGRASTSIALKSNPAFKFGFFFEGIPWQW